jgi:signal transduction histidine kinase/CheY-like chemotaxis protein
MSVRYAAIALSGFLGVAYYSHLVLDRYENNRFIDQTDRIARKAFFDLKGFEHGLYGVRGFFAGSQNVSREEFRQFVGVRNLKDEFPGSLGLGYIARVRQAAVDSFVEAQRKDLVPDFKFQSLSEYHGDPYIIQFIEPDSSNRPALGLNVASETFRREAAERAMHSGKPTITEPITLVQDRKQRTGFLFFLPQYRTDLPLETDKQRDSALLGWAYFPLVIDPIIERNLKPLYRHYGFELFETRSNGEAKSIFISHPENMSEIKAESRFSHAYVDTLGDRQWLLIAYSRPSFVTWSSRIIPSALVVMGFIVSAFIMSLVFVMRRTEKKALTLATEMTQQLRDAKEAADSASAAKSRFLATMSHEIRTPMNGFLGMLQVLESTPLNDEQRECTSTMKHSGESLLQIINDILDFSKIEAGKLELENRNFSLLKICQESVELLIYKAKEKNLDLSLAYPPSAPRYFQGDPGRIRQVILNFLSNAIKFTEAGSVRLQVELQRVPHAEGASEASATHVSHQVTLTVIDTGIGIRPDQINKLFRDFSQADSSTTRKFGGTGLGLAISKSLVESMGGQVHVESRNGKGSKFSFWLYLKEGSGTVTADLPKPSSPGPTQDSRDWTARPQGDTLLVAEDNTVNQRVLIKMLRHFGYACDIAANGAEAVEMAERRAYPLVLMDCQMPEIDGLEATRKIRAGHGPNRNSPIIALTANATEQDRQACADAGMNDFLSKPLRQDLLVEVLKRHHIPVPLQDLSNVV